MPFRHQPEKRGAVPGGGGCAPGGTVRVGLRARTVEARVPYFREGRILRLTPEAVARMSEEEYASYAFGWRKKEVMLRNLCLRKEE